MSRRSSVIVIAVVCIFLAVTQGCKTEGDTVNVNVPNDVFNGLTIEPATGYLMVAGMDNPLRCIAHYQQSAEQDWTNRVRWSVSDESWASISLTGVLRPKKVGVGEVLAASPEGWIATTQITVQSVVNLSLHVSEPVLLKGEETGMELTALLDDGIPHSLPARAISSWSFTDSLVAHVTADGSLHGDRLGQTALVASAGSVSSFPAIVTVDSVLSLSVEIVSQSPYLPLDTLRAVCTAGMRYSGNFPASSRAHWSTTDPASFVSLGNGLFVPVTSGQFSVQAVYGGVSASPLAVEIWHVDSLTITPTQVTDTLSRGDSVLFHCQAVIANHGTQDLTDQVQWISTNTVAGDFVAPGVFVGKRTGMTEVLAQSGFTMSSRITINVFSLAVFADDFESYNLGLFSSNARWEVYADGTAEVNVSSVASTGVRSCELADSDYSYNCGINNVAGAYEGIVTGSVELDVRPGPGQWTWVGGPYSNETAAQIEFNSGGQINFNGSYVQSYEASTWYHLRVDFDCNTDRCDFYIDGVLVRSNASFYYTQSSITYVGTYSSPAYTSGCSYVDNVTISDLGSAPSAPPSQPRAADPTSGNIWTYHHDVSRR